MINFVAEEVIKKFLDANKKKGEEKVIIEDYLLPEALDNMYELAKVKTLFKGIEFNIFDVVHVITPEEFEVGDFNFPFQYVHMNFSSFSKVEDKILTSKDKDIAFFRKLYQAIRLVDEKKDLNKFRRDEYRLFSESLKSACEKIEIMQ